jgi:myo-inositol-1(or 4)-monophosphatase
VTDLNLQTRYLAACAIAREAGDLARRLYQSRPAGSFELKGPQDYLTEADGEVERLVVSRLNAAFPEDKVFGEEGGGALGSRCWAIDPIDGTSNFARGIPHFCVSIAFIDQDQFAVGAINDPMVGELFSAMKGGGAWLNGSKLAVSATRELAQAQIELGWSTRVPLADYIAMLERTVEAGAAFVRAGSGALAIAYVAAGRLDGYAELHINLWDCAAALLMVTEAGGWTNDFMAGSGLTRGNPVLACNPQLREALCGVTGIAG